MNNFNVVFEKDAECFKEYGYQELVEKFFKKFLDRAEYGLIGTVKITGAEISKRVYIENDKGEEFTIRYFIQNENAKSWGASCTLYKMVNDHGEEIDSYLIKAIKYIKIESL